MQTSPGAWARALRPFLIWLYLPTLALLVAIGLISQRTQVHVSLFTRDPTAILQASPFLGLLSNLGVLGWCAGAAVCFFSAAVLSRQAGVAYDLLGLLWSSGALTTLLLVDDLFRIHDFVLPTYLWLRQEFSYAAYLVIITVFLLRHRHILLATDIAPLLIALSAFGASVLLDSLFEGRLPWHFLIEDGLKLIGIVGWSGYLIHISFRALSTASAH